MSLNSESFQKCIWPACGATFDLAQTLVACPNCGNLLDICYDWDHLPVPKNLDYFEQFWSQRRNPQRFSGVWRFHELLPFADLEDCLTIGEGQTSLQQADRLAAEVGLPPGNLMLQYEGFNPSGSFKDNGMAAALTHASIQGAEFAACASTGNTSASLAMFAAVTGAVKAIVFVGSGKIAYGKLSQALDYGACTIQIDGDFDDAMQRVRQVCPELGIYLVNSVNPFRLEGQKTIMLRVLESLQWQPPDWIVVPGGNLGNSSSFGKIFGELKMLGLIDRIPRIAVINAEGASTLNHLYNQKNFRWQQGQFSTTKAQDYFDVMRKSNATANTVASAIEINFPVNLAKCLRALEITDGVVRDVTDEEILDHKAMIARHGFGCEPASGASLAGVRRLREEGLISDSDRVVCILTGHVLKDPNVTVGYHTDQAWREEQGIRQATFANPPVTVPNELEQIIAAINQSH